MDSDREKQRIDLESETLESNLLIWLAVKLKELLLPHRFVLLPPLSMRFKNDATLLCPLLRSKGDWALETIGNRK